MRLNKNSFTVFLLLLSVQTFFVDVVAADTLCVPRFQIYLLKTSIVPDGEACPRGTRAAGTILGKQTAQELVADAISNTPEEPHRFNLSAKQGEPPVCQGIDVKSRCSDQTGCTLRFRTRNMRLSADHPAYSIGFVLPMKYDSENHLVTIRFDGLNYTGKLGDGQYHVVFHIANVEVYIASEKPADECVDTTNVIDDGPDTIWLRTNSNYSIDGALLD